MPKILVVDDDLHFRKMLCEMLSSKGYQVVSASDGNKAIPAFRKEHPDLVVTDILMPNKEGLETILDLQSEFPDVKIIAVSGGGVKLPKEYLKGALRLANVKKTFMKPFGMTEFLHAVEEVLQMV